MEEPHGLTLCTFEVATPLGTIRRVGAYRDRRYIDLNFATAWYLDQTSEPDAQRLADALVPADMRDFLRAGLRALHTSEELFLGSGPHPADWWVKDDPPRGPGGETLVYGADQVRLLAPLPAPRTLAPGADAPAASEWRAYIAAVVGAAKGECQPIAGYTLVIECGEYRAMGPYIVTPDLAGRQMPFAVRVNGAECFRATAPEPRDANSLIAQPCAGDVAASPPVCAPNIRLKPGDVIEAEAPALGALKVQVR